MKKKLSKLLAAISCMCLLISMAAAADIKITPAADGDKPVGASWSLYKIADKDAYGIYALLDDYSECETPVEGMTTADVAKLAGDAHKIIVEKEIEADYTGKADDKGVATIEGVEKGIYVYVAEEITVEYTKFSPVPAIFEVTGLETEAIEISAKLVVEKLPTPTPTSTVTPSATPSATPTVTGPGMDTSGGYGNITYTPTPTLPGKLPQTGQLLWPIPVLMIAGIILVAIGVTISAKTKKDE